MATNFAPSSLLTVALRFHISEAKSCTAFINPKAAEKQATFHCKAAQSEEVTEDQTAAAELREREREKEGRMGGEEGRAKRMGSLGWLTESAVMPKKRKAIEGVGASSIVELKAQLYRTQEETRKTRDSAPDSSEYLRAKKKVLPSGPFSHRNSGVQERDNRDKLELKAVKDGSASYAALEKKAELYEKLARGELSDEEEKERYCVDFFQKIITKADEQPEERQAPSSVPQENKDSEYDDVLLGTRLFGPGRTNTTLDSDEHKRFVREVHEEASQAREKTTMLKMLRQEQEAARREKLRQAYLRKQLQKLTSSNQKPAADGSS